MTILRRIRQDQTGEESCGPRYDADLPPGIAVVTGMKPDLSVFMYGRVEPGIGRGTRAEMR